jgi:hypothetical protein
MGGNPRLICPEEPFTLACRRPDLTGGDEFHCCIDSSSCEGMGGRNVEMSPYDAASLVSEGCQGGPGFVNTAIGCIPYDAFSNMARFFLSWSLGVGGGIGLALIAMSAFMFITSSGNPDKLNSAKSLFIAALSGLVMIVLCVFLLKLISVNILGLFS